jgi:hypothetical protein
LAGPATPTLGCWLVVNIDVREDATMYRASRKLLLTVGVALSFAVAESSAQANEALIKMSGNPADWVMPARTYDLQRISPLK